MNRDRLNIIIEQYVERFSELNNEKTYNEGFKWEAVSLFQKNWDINVKDFRQMFINAMDGTSVLLDNRTVQPVGGIRALLNHEEEIEFVRECFNTLFSEDHGDVKQRQLRIEKFVEAVNGRIETYISGSWKYPQKLNNVLFYLNLWRPEENYIYKYTEAEAWATYMEYGEDLGSGASFSLEKYYDICEELRNELTQYEKLMELHRNRIAQKAVGYDDNLHMLVYDIIYCAYAYNFYSKLNVDKLSTKQRIERAKKQQEIDEINSRIEEVNTLLSEVIQQQKPLPDLSNMVMKHKKYGVGVVESCNENHVDLNFSGERKKLQYPFVVIKGILTCDDQSILDRIYTENNMRSRKAVLQKELDELRAKLKALL